MTRLTATLATKISLFVALTTICFAGVSEGNVRLDGRSLNSKIYQSSLIALENIISVQDTVQDRLDQLEGQEKKLSEERKKLLLVAKDLQAVFPSGRDLDRHTKGFFKRLRQLGREREELTLVRSYAESRMKENTSTSSRAVVLGVLTGVLCAVLGVVAWKGVGKSRSKNAGFDNRLWNRRLGKMSNYLDTELQLGIV